MNPSATQEPGSAGSLDFSNFDVILFDLDGVLTPTAEIHEEAWSRLFTPYLEQRGAAPYTTSDYFDYIDGKPRSGGVASLLESRGISLPFGEREDSPDMETVHGLGNRKNVIVNQMLDAEGIVPFPGSVALLDALPGTTIRDIAVVSSSWNARKVLTSAQLIDRFETIVDGSVAAELGLPGKPLPDTYLYAAQQLNVAPERAIVVEDAISGVKSGHAGHFGAVVGVDRGAGRDALFAAGATHVVSDLSELADVIAAGE